MKTIDLQPDEYLGEDGLAYCKNCHTPRVCRIEDRYFPINCKCQREAYEKAEYERKLQERKAKAEEYRRNSALGKHFSGCTFETATIVSSNKAVYQMCRNYCTHADKMYDAGVGAYLYGVPGVGKTHLTACMGNALADKLYTVLFTSFVEIESKLKEGFGNNSAQSAVLRRAEMVDFLFLDDIGTENINGDTVKDILSGMKKLTSAVIILDPREDEPQVVFESINSTGLDLSLADLIRNFILMTDKDQEKLFEEYWIKIEGNIGQKNMPAFITDFLQFACRENVTNQNAYVAFKNYFKTEQFTNEQLLAKLLHYSEYYKAFLGNINNKYSNEVNRKLAGFKALDQATIYPFLFHVFDDYESAIISTTELEKVLTFFLNYLMRRIVCGVGSNSLRGLYKTLYNRIFADKENLENYFDAIVAFFMQVNTKNAIPSDSLFKDSLMNTDIYNKKNACKYILKTIEEMTEDGTVNKEILDVSTFSIEHIMPQKLSDYWKQALGANFEKVHEKYLHNLGNLTLTGYNSELGQKTFEEKKQLITDKNSHMPNE